MLPSGNDAATVISENLGALTFYMSKKDVFGTIKNLINNKDKREELYTLLSSLANASGYFISEMNKYSRYLNITNSMWCNPHGLSNKY